MSNLTLYLCSEAELPKEYKYIKFNDAYFNKYYTDYKIDETAKNIIKSIDDVEYTGNYRFKSKFEPNADIKLDELSTGCKTALNVYFNQDKIFTVAECGTNAIKEILNLPQGNIYFSFYTTIPDFTNSLKVVYDNNIEEVTDKYDLRGIMSKYFK